MTNISCSPAFLLKTQKIKELFSGCSTPQLKYEKIIELGRQLPSYPTELKTPDNLVKGCQSEMYLASSVVDGNMFFQACSDALIPAGLAALLLFIYNGEPPETLLCAPPEVLEELGIRDALSPSRSNGLSSLFLRMKQDALSCLCHRE